MNNPLTKEELLQMVKDAGKPVVVWLRDLKYEEQSDWAMFDGTWITNKYGPGKYFRDCYNSGNFCVYPDKPAGPLTLTGDEAATMRYLVSKSTWARYIRRFPRCVYLMEDKGKPHVQELPYEFFPLLRESVMYEICIDEDGTVRLFEEA